MVITMNTSRSNGHYACVDCRESFKGTHKCPRCGKLMQYMGKHWTAPRKSNDKAWKLLANGIRLWDTRHRIKRIRQFPNRYSSVVFKQGKRKNNDTYYYGYDVDDRRK